ncbi:MAG: tetratricopeptide repeat protein [Candidatus Melainabacteria bacterium]|nr:tetratricopeptide repeat protein [Candidatus Melainabacteria bacterium]
MKQKIIFSLIVAAISMPVGIQKLEAAQSSFTELSNEAIEYYKKGKMKDAERLFLEAIEEAGKSTAKDDNMCVGLTNLAGLYKMQGKFVKAEPIYKRAMLIQQRDFGPNDLKVAIAADNYADILMRNDKFKEAEEYYRKGLSIRQKKLASTDGEIGKNMVNLAEALEEQKSFEEAIALYRKGIPILQEAFGPKDLYLAKALNHFGWLYRDMGNLEQAESLYLRSMAIYESKSVNEPNIAMVSKNLAEVYRKQGKFADAEDMYKKSILIREKVYDPRHLSISYVLEEYSSLLKELGRVEEAELLDERIYNIKVANGKEVPPKEKKK